MGEFDKLNNADIDGLIDTWNRRIITLRVMIVVFAAFFVSVCVYLYRLDKYTTLVNTYIAKVDEYTYKLDELNDYITGRLSDDLTDSSLMFDFVFEEDNYYV